MGQAGGTGFVAVMALTSFPLGAIRITALALNVVAAGYAPARLTMTQGLNWPLLVNLLAGSVPAAFLGGCVALPGKLASIVTAWLLLAASLVLIWGRIGQGESRKISTPAALTIGTATGFASGLSGIGGGVFLAPLLLVFGNMSPSRVAGLSPPFILANSGVALVGTLMTGQRLSPVAIPLMLAALAGSVIGTTIGLRWRSDNFIRFVLGGILGVAAGDLLLRT